MMSLSRHTNEKMRGHSAALMAPLWEKILVFKYFFLHPSQPSPFSHLSPEEEKQHLQLENQLLKIEIAYLQKQLEEQLSASSQIAALHPVPARVIFRSFDTWNSFLWINVGESTNSTFEAPVIAYNSPVIVGKAIVGIIDFVGEHQSRVRLISDNRLTPSVRACRGGEQEALMSEKIEGLLQQINHKQNLPLSSEEQTNLFRLLQQLKKNLQPLKKSWYLAKGELLGSTFSARLGQNVSLQGRGFNYDFADEEGESRDLRNGKSMQQAQAIPILKANDILVTTGMDGIFPPGFQVAVVTQVGLLKEGDYFYHLEARPIAGPLEELSLVFVLPPLKKEK